VSPSFRKDLPSLKREDPRRRPGGALGEGDAKTSGHLPTACPTRIRKLNREISSGKWSTAE
jgi:hypothetical protein